MSAQPVHEPDLDDPVEILRVLPAHFREQFLREYYGAAAGAAREVGGYRQLHGVLRLWRLTAVAHSEPGFAERLAAMREAVESGNLEGQRLSRTWCRAGPTADSAYRMVVFGAGYGLLSFYADDAAELIRIFDITWIG